MDSMIEQVWEKSIAADISVSAALDAHTTRCRRRDFEIVSAMLKTGDTQKAQELLCEVISAAPSWDYLTVTTVAKLISESFLISGQFDNAIKYAERGLEWDPTHPELIALLCKSYATVNPEKSLYYYGFFKSAGFSESLLDGYTVPGSSKTAKEYTITIESFRKISADTMFRFMVYQAAALHRRPLFETIDSLRNHALACISSGNLVMAQVALRLALFRTKDPLYISGLNPVMIQIKAKWIRALDQFVTSAIEKDSKAKGLISSFRISEKLFDRRHAVEDLMSAKNSAGLFNFVMDPAAEISFLACQYLVDLGDEKKVREYVLSAFSTEQKYKEMYGEFKPYTIVRTMSSASIIDAVIADTKKSGSGSTESDSLEDGVPGRKIVRKKLVMKDSDPDDLPEDKPAPKKPGRKKKVETV